MSIEEEYDKHQTSKELLEQVDDPYSFIICVEELMKALDKDEIIAARKIGINRIIQFIFPFGLETLQEEKSQHELQFDIAEATQNRLNEIIELLTDENFKELLKLVDFLVMHYHINKRYIQSRLVAIEKRKMGINYIDNRQRYTHDELMKFANKKIDSMKINKHLEKQTEV